jgi:hypothetical protein
MPVATNQQMQAFADQRIRPRAEQFRALVNSLRDDKASIDEWPHTTFAPTATTPIRAWPMTLRTPG